MRKFHEIELQNFEKKTSINSKGALEILKISSSSFFTLRGNNYCFFG